MSEIAFLDHIRDLQTERANEVLDREDFELDENPHLIPGLDPKMFDPMSVTSKNGMPDIEKLKQIFRHSKR